MISRLARYRCFSMAARAAERVLLSVGVFKILDLAFQQQQREI